MKKLLFLTIISGILLAGCNPNEELYDELDKETSDAYTDQLEYTLTEGDYATIADLALANATSAEDSNMIENIDTYGAFGDEFKAADYVPAFLANKYLALDEGSVIRVSYNYMGSMEILNQLSATTYYTLTRDDYDSMGEGTDEPGEYNNFAYDINPDDYLPDFLASTFPEAEEGDQIAVSYDYYNYGEVTVRTDFYTFESGAWQKGEASVSNLYVLNESDYDAMGAPGNYDNFSEDDDPQDYLPTFLKNKYPYAHKGDFRYIVYDYYSSGDTYTRSRKYTFDGETWKPYVQESNQFIHGSEGWAFDPTVRFTMSGDDYQLIVDERASSYVDSYGNTEFYSGASSYYGNFDMRQEGRIEQAPEYADLSEEEAEELMWERILVLEDEPMETRGALVVMLQKKFPNAVPEQNGVPVYYEVTFDTYYGGGKAPVYTAKYQCTASGDPATFEYIESDTPYSE
jgi:hypothetical protein